MAKGKKTGGRVAGVPNKITRDLFTKLEEVGLDPWAEMIKIANSGADPNQFQALKEMLQYLYPKRKAMEVSGSLDLRLQEELKALMNLTEEELMGLLKEEQKK